MDLSEARWHKSSRSGQTGGNCVEVATNLPAVAVRDSKDQAGPVLAFGRNGWASFLATVKADKLG